MMDGNIRVVELFAGVGGFRLGLETASERYETVWANQWEPSKRTDHAFLCYDYHFSGTSSVNVNRDIGDVKGEIPDHDLLVGGFPCQDYSVASTNAKGIEGKKGVLWWHIDDIIKEKRPSFVLLENVDRLVKSPVSQRGRDFGIILRCLADSGYDAEWRVINAADYGHVQRRRRIFILAYRRDTFHASFVKESTSEDVVSSSGFFAVPFPIVRTPVMSKVSEFSIGPEKYPTLLEVSESFQHRFHNAGLMRGHRVYSREAAPRYEGRRALLGDILEKDVDERFYVRETDKWQFLKGAKKLERTKKDGFKFFYSEGSIPFPDPLDRPSRTMLTSEGTVNRSSHLVSDPVTGRLRILTPVECERLNGFPDGWTGTGMTERMRYFTMGNALVVPLIQSMGSRLLQLVDQRPG